MNLNAPRRTPVLPLFPIALAAKLLCAGGLAIAWAPEGAVAAEPAATAAARQSFDIPAGALGTAIHRFVAASGVLVSADGALTDGKHSPGARGPMAAQEALMQLLGGTGLHAVRQRDGSYLLQALPPSRAEGALPTVTVQDTGNPTTEGSGSYAARGPSATATGLAMGLRDTPQSVSVMARQRIEDQALSDVRGVLENTPGITVLGSMSDQQSIYARGFTVENYQYDGLPTRVDSGWDGGMTKADSAIYDRIEVLRGSAGLLNGAGNPSATVNMVRKRPTRQFQGQVQAQAGSWNLARAEADVSGALNASGSVRGRGVMARQERDSFQDYRSTDKSLLYGVLEADLPQGMLLTVGAEWQRSTTRGATYGSIPLFYSDGSQTTDIRRSFNPGNPWGYWRQENRNLFATLEQQLSSGWSWKAGLSHQRIEDDALASATSGGNPDRLTGAGVTQYACRCLSTRHANVLDMQASGPFQLWGREHELVLGLNAQNMRRDNPGYTVSDFDSAVPNLYQWSGQTPQPGYGLDGGYNNERIRQWGAYGTVRLKPTEALALIVGTRISSWKQSQASDFGFGANASELSQSGIVTPYAGIVYALTPQYRLYASYADIFNPQIGYRNAQNQPLDPLSGTNLEAGIKGEFMDGRLQASAAVFRVLQDNLAVLDEAHTAPLPGGASAYRMAKGVKSQGFELELTGELRPGWQIQAGFTQRRSRDANGVAVATNQPRQLLRLWSTYRLGGAWSGLTVGGGVNWQSELRYTASGWGVPAAVLGKTAVQPSYALVGLMARYAFTPRTSVTAVLNNLTDRKYYSGFGSYAGGIYGEPRNLSVRLSHRF